MPEAGSPKPEAGPEDADPASAVVSGTLRAPWKWESLLVESAVIGGADRWSRRLTGLDREYELKIRALQSEEPDSPRIPRLERERQNLEHLRAFALPLIESMSAWSDSASWGDWLQRLEGLVPRVLRKPADVLRILADLRPMGAVGPVGLTEVRDVLADRLMSLEVDPPANRYGRVFIGSPHQARGRSFRIVFVPGLAERLFPQKLREDPLLLDDLRPNQVGPVAQGALKGRHRAFGSPANSANGGSPVADQGNLPVQEDRADLERLLLRLAVGASTERLYVSFPRIETAEARQRVPSFYALEVMRAVTGKIPDHHDTRNRSGGGSQREPCVAGARQGRRRHRRFRARPVGPSRVDAQQRSCEGTRALHAAAERLSAAVCHRALGAFEITMVAVRRHRAGNRRDPALSADATSRKETVFSSPHSRTTPTVPIDFCFLPSTGSSRSKSPSRCSASIRSRKAACSTKCRPSFQSAATRQETDCDDAYRDGAQGARRDVDAYCGQVRRRSGARRRSRMAGRDCEHAHRPSRVGAQPCRGQRVGAVALRVCVRLAQRSDRTRGASSSRSEQHPRSRGDRRPLSPARLDRSCRTQAGSFRTRPFCA